MVTVRLASNVVADSEINHEVQKAALRWLFRFNGLVFEMSPVWNPLSGCPFLGAPF